MIKKNFIIGFFLLVGMRSSLHAANDLLISDIWQKTPSDIWGKIFEIACIMNYEIFTIKMISKKGHEIVKALLTQLPLELKKLRPINLQAAFSIQDHFFIKALQKVDKCIEFTYSCNAFKAKSVPKITFDNTITQESCAKIQDCVNFLSKKLGFEHSNTALICLFNQYYKYYQVLNTHQHKISPF